MVTTRGRQPISITTTITSTAVKNTPLDDAPVLFGGSIHPDTDLYDDRLETIGSRLRKRRRTEQPPSTGLVRSSKRSTPKTIGLPTSKQTQTSVDSKESAYSISSHSPYITPYSSSDTLPAHSVEPTQSSNHHFAAVDDPRINGVTGAVSEVAEDPALPETISQSQLPMSITAVSPDLAALIREIVEHGEAIDRSYGEMGHVDTESFVLLGASLHLKTQCLPILDNLATQILNTLAKSTYIEILNMATNPDSEAGQAYTSLKSLFNHTKKVYSIEEHFLSPFRLGLTEIAHFDTIRKANMATFVSSVFGSQDVGFYYLNEYFLETFVADGNRLLKSQGQLFLDLKTHAYISASSSGQHSREELLEDLFPDNLEERILSRRLGAKQLAPSEADFLKRARNRSLSLLADSQTEEAVAALPEKYIWEDFLRDVRAYLIKNFADITGIPTRASPRSSRASNFFVTDLQPPQQPQQSRQASQYYNAQPIQQTSEQEFPLDRDRVPTQMPPEQCQIFTETDDIAEKAARAAQFAIQGFDMNQAAVAPHSQMQNHIDQHIQLQPQQFQYHFEHQAPTPHYFQQAQYYQDQQMQNQIDQQPINISHQHQVYADQNAIPYHTQSAPTKDLYARARAAASAKASPTSRRAGHPSQRRPWTTDEENALMQGLDCVKGPHWSQILAMFGPGGTINEILKDRNQVQLKDKARNLKLFFLKSQIEVPYYLSFVTGELKTRAPAQAAKNEAKDKEKLSEDRAHVEGVMTLARGLISDGEGTVGTENGADECYKNEGDESFRSEVPDETDGLESQADEHFDDDELSGDNSEVEPSLGGKGYLAEQPLPYANISQVNGDNAYTNGLLQAVQLEANKLTVTEPAMLGQIGAT